jgi:hypothetical protein
MPFDAPIVLLNSLSFHSLSTSKGILEASPLSRVLAICESTPATGGMILEKKRKGEKNNDDIKQKIAESNSSGLQRPEYHYSA